MQAFPAMAAPAASSLHSPTRLARAYGELYFATARRALGAGDFATALALVDEGLRLIPLSFQLPVGAKLKEAQSAIRMQTPTRYVLNGEVVLMSPGAVMGPEVIFL